MNDLLEKTKFDINDIIKIQSHTFKIIENLDNAVKTVHLEINNE